MKAASRSSMVLMPIVTPASHRNNAEARTRAGFGHQKIGRGWQGDVRLKVSALGVPSLSDVPCIGGCRRGLRGGATTTAFPARTSASDVLAASSVTGLLSAGGDAN